MVKAIHKRNIFLLILIFILLTNITYSSNLHEEIYKGNLNRIRYLIECKPELIQTKDSSGFTPLEISILLGKREIAEILVNQGAKPTIHVAVFLNNIILVEKLLKKDSSLVNSKDPWGNRPLHLVTSLGIAKVLIDKHGEVDAVNDMGWSPLHAVAVKGKRDIADYLKMNGATVDFLTTVLLGQINEVNTYLKKNPSLANAKSKFGMTPLQAVAMTKVKDKKSIEELAKLLIAHGANVNQRDQHGFSILHFAENENIAKLLIKHGADVNAKGPNDWTPLHTTKNKNIVELLLASGANISASADDNDSKSTPLHKSLQNGCEDVARLLIEKGSDINNGGDELGTPLHIACEYDQVEIVKLLIAKGADVNSTKILGESTPLHVAWNKEIAGILIDKGANINAKDSMDRTPLYDATISGNKEVVELLIAHDAQIDNVIKLIDIAASLGYLDIAKLLLNKSKLDNILTASLLGDVERVEAIIKSNPKSVYAIDYPSGKTPLHYAQNHQIVELLLKHKANVNAKDYSGKTPLHYARSPQAVELLFKHKANVNAKDLSGKTPLHDAAKRGDINVIKALLSYKVDINARCGVEQTPLHEAIDIGNYETTKILIEHGADINAKSYNGTPIRMAYSNNNPAIAKLLIENGANADDLGTLEATQLGISDQLSADINIFDAVSLGMKDKVESLLRKNPELIHEKDMYGQTPLHLAHDLQIASYLIYHGADLTAKDRRGMTPLQGTVYNGHHNVAKMFINNGAEIDIFSAALLGLDKKVQSLIEQDPNLINEVNYFGFTPLHAAAHQIRTFSEIFHKDDVKAKPKDKNELTSYINIIELLLSKKMNINAKDKRGLTPLHYAVLRDDTIIPKLLIENGADINCQTKKAETPLHLATVQEHEDMVRLLLDSHADKSIKDVKGNTALNLAKEKKNEKIVKLLESQMNR